jgi:predicted Zn-dependent protease
MTGRIWLLGIVLLGSCVGCVPGPTQNTTLVPGNPFISSAAGTKIQTQELSAEGKAESIRVARVGQQILAANPQIPIKPQFLTVGESAPEIFHRGGQDVIITESLASKCKTDGQLAAVLCHELGKQVTEREALQRFMPRSGNGPPADVPVGNDYHGGFSAEDGTRMMELGKYEEDLKRRRAESISPDTLAKIYLQKAGQPPELLAEVAPLLRAADQNATLEKQLNHAPLPPG